jgi:hypothetical protein
MDGAQPTGGEQPAWPACPRCGGAGVKAHSERYVYQNDAQGAPRLVSVTRAFACNGCGHRWSQASRE